MHEHRTILQLDADELVMVEVRFAWRATKYMISLNHHASTSQDSIVKSPTTDLPSSNRKEALLRRLNAFSTPPSPP